MKGRLIDDVRRRRMLVLGATLAIMLAVLWIGRNALCSFRDGNLEYVMRILTQTELRIARLDGIVQSAFDATASNWTNLVVQMNQKLTKSTIAESDIDFIVQTRQQSSRLDAKRLADEYNIAASEFAQSQKTIETLVADGEMLVEGMSDKAISIESDDVTEALKDLCRFRNAMIEELSSPWTILWHKPKIDEESERIDGAWNSSLAREGWKKRLDIVMNYQSLTNEIHSACLKQDNLEGRMKRIVEELSAMPFDGSNSIFAVRSILEGKLDKAEAEWDKIEVELENVVTLLNQLELKCDEFMKTGLSELNDLHQQHGTYVESTAIETMQGICTQVEADRNAFLERFRGSQFQITNEMQRIVAIREEIYAHTNLLANASGLPSRELESLCHRGTELARVMDLRTLINDIHALMMATDRWVDNCSRLQERFTKGIARVRESLPDWMKLAEDISNVRKEQSSEVIELKNRLMALQGKLAPCRADDESTMLDLRSSMDKIENVINKIGKSCVSVVACTNGVSASSELAINASIKGALTRLKDSMREIETKTNSMFSDGRIYRVGYVRDTLNWGNDIKNGRRNFSIALDFPVAGQHRVEVRLSKRRGNYLFRSSGRHDIKISGTIKDGYGRSSLFDETKNDSTASWGQFNLAVLESMCTAGRNGFELELNFSSKGYNALSGEWRFELLEFEIWVDGKKNNSVYRLQKL